MSDNLSVLSLHGSCRSARSFMLLVHAFFYPLLPKEGYGSIHTTGMAHNTPIRPFPELYNATPFELFELFLNSSLRHTSLAKNATNTTSLVRMETMSKMTLAVSILHQTDIDTGIEFWASTSRPSYPPNINVYQHWWTAGKAIVQKKYLSQSFFPSNFF